MDILPKVDYITDPENTKADDACFPLSDYKIKPDPDVDHFPIILVDRGSCSFVTKTRHVQKAGGHLAIIVDNTDEDVEDILMIDDGTGSDITIPAILISKSEGLIIKDYITSIKNDEKALEKVEVSIEFKMVR